MRGDKFLGFYPTSMVITRERQPIYTLGSPEPIGKFDSKSGAAGTIFGLPPGREEDELAVKVYCSDQVYGQIMFIHRDLGTATWVGAPTAKRIVIDEPDENTDERSRFV